MKATAIFLSFAAVHALKECDDITITSKLKPVIASPSMQPCITELGVDCFSSSGNDAESCAKKAFASRNCEAAWYEIAKVLASIEPSCKISEATTADLSQLEWAQFIKALNA
jgi:hypothetical protein